MRKIITSCSIVFFTIIAMAFCASYVQAHEWYSNRSDPASKMGCCGGSDCAPVPIDADWVQPVSNGLHVVLTLEQAKTFNIRTGAVIDEVVPWSRVMALSAGYNGPPAFYHICIVGDELRCVFAVPTL
jgi:hypothetical protein